LVSEKIGLDLEKEFKIDRKSIVPSKIGSRKLSVMMYREKSPSFGRDYNSRNAFFLNKSPSSSEKS